MHGSDGGVASHCGSAVHGRVTNKVVCNNMYRIVTWDGDYIVTHVGENLRECFFNTFNIFPEQCLMHDLRWRASETFTGLNNLPIPIVKVQNSTVKITSGGFHSQVIYSNPVQIGIKIV